MSEHRRRERGNAGTNDCRSTGERWRNWSGRVTCNPREAHRPETEAGIRDALAAAGPDATVRVAGSGHSFSAVVPSDDVLLSLENYTGVVDVDPEAGRATVRAGTPLYELTDTLASHGLAMENLGDVDTQTLAGAISTGTHGTGRDFGVLSTQVRGMRLATADGDVLELTDGDPRLDAARVSLGALGVVTEVTLDLVESYRLRERVWTAPVEEVLENADRYAREHRNFEFFWFPYTDRALVKTLDRTDDPPREADGLLGETVENAAWEAMCRVGNAVPAASKYMAKLAAATVSTGESVGRWHEVYPTARDVRFNETEYAVPAADGPAALRAIRQSIEERSEPVQFPVEFRYVAGDEIPLSPAYGGDRAFVAVHKYHRRSHREFFEACEEVFRRFDGRPHWGKTHYRSAEDLADLYPAFDRFRSVRRELDPDGVFLNDHLRTVLGEG